MNYQSFASFNDIPPAYGREPEAFYDRGSGVPMMNKNNMTVQDIFRTPFLLYAEHRADYNNMAPEALKGIQTGSELSKLFFSDENIKRVQRMIKKEVFKRTNGEFRLDVDLDKLSLFLAMRGVYLEEARFLLNETVRQVKRLNQKVVTSTIAGVLTNIRQDYGYLKEINKPRTLIPREMNANNASRRSLPSVMTTFGF
jgi:hypothetical protein